MATWYLRTAADARLRNLCFRDGQLFSFRVPIVDTPTLQHFFAIGMSYILLRILACGQLHREISLPRLSMRVW